MLCRKRACFERGTKNRGLSAAGEKKATLAGKKCSLGTKNPVMVREPIRLQGLLPKGNGRLSNFKNTNGMKERTNTESTPNGAYLLELDRGREKTRMHLFLLRNST